MGVLVTNICVNNNRVSADVFVNQEKNEVWYEFPWNMENITTRPANAFLAIFLPITMRVGGDLEIDGEISESIYNSMSTYQDIMKKWYPELQKVKISATKISRDLEFDQKKKVISCFTGGVDAFYTLIKNQNKIDDLLYVWGFDIPLTENAFYAKVRDHMSTVAEKFGKEIVFVKTNLGFEVTNKYASWGDYCYGAAIASVLLLMTSKYELCLMPSCNDYSVLVPRGSHLLINHLWGCDGLSFVYDGAEAARVEKVDYIADNKVVQNHLRVCYRSRDAYNCCECEKCIRTMVSLEALNKLDKVSTFSKPLIVEKISEIELENDSEEKMAEASLDVALKNGKNELAVQLRQQILRYKSKGLLQELNENLDMLFETPEFRDISTRISEWNIENNTKYMAKRIAKTSFKKVKRILVKRN